MSVEGPSGGAVSLFFGAVDRTMPSAARATAASDFVVAAPAEVELVTGESP